MSTENQEESQKRELSKALQPVFIPLLTALLGLGGGHTVSTYNGTHQLAQEVKDLGKEITLKLEAQDARLASVERSVEKIEERSQDRWTKTEMRLWVAELRRRNPEWDVPDPLGAQ